MKKKLAVFLVFLSIFAYSQKIGVVDTDYVLDKLPQYKEAKKRLDAQISNWQADLQTKQADLQKKKEAFESEKVLLVGEQLKQRQKEIDDLDSDIRKLINVKFGTDGEINKLRSSLVNPFQDQIWNAIKIVVEKNSLGIVLDKSNNISVLFLDKRFDYTDKVLDVLLKNDPEAKTKKTKK
ncbi:OmpH family outer membrane protein [Elizabethkingia sp. JS20170427COW]|uniref:OmpH family outer membrane protein n=1 Tax=Elizabethkingia sp. JS20170427COW TaxID=2583851 RepID=UPI001110E212|nr:OmpH family outer membrane protein [Elizabethkingia sp. JS20170427COW]QCX53307.1 OmpH family outer membrane protein [Elizabethkingia sp. JS20170427COW]